MDCKTPSCDLDPDQLDAIKERLERVDRRLSALVESVCDPVYAVDRVQTRECDTPARQVQAVEEVLDTLEDRVERLNSGIKEVMPSMVYIPADVSLKDVHVANNIPPLMEATLRDGPS